MKIASLLPSATEIVYALGLGDQLVGVTFECDYPPEARRRATILVGGMATSEMSPGDIDQAVHDQLDASGNLYELHAERLRDLAPDVIVTQDLCRVCAVPSGRVDAALHRIGCSSRVVSMDPMTLDDVLASVIDVAEACGVRDRGEALVATARQRLAVTAAAVAGRAAPRVFVLEWVDPPFLAGHWVPDVVAAAGGDPVLCTPGARSHATDWAEIAAAEPDVIVVAPCGFGTDAAAAQAASVLNLLPPSVPVWAIDANAYIVRPSIRLVDGAAILAGIFHPDVVPAPDAAQARRVR
jgi:iron complex transport system substrate-binding protein